MAPNDANQPQEGSQGPEPLKPGEQALPAQEQGGTQPLEGLQGNIGDGLDRYPSTTTSMPEIAPEASTSTTTPPEAPTTTPPETPGFGRAEASTTTTASPTTTTTTAPRPNTSLTGAETGTGEATTTTEPIPTTTALPPPAEGPPPPEQS
jgi:hypothetical protein